MAGDGVRKEGEETTDERGRYALPEGGVGESSTQDTRGGSRAPPNPAGDRGGGDNLLGWPLDGEGIAEKEFNTIIVIGFIFLVVYVDLFGRRICHTQKG